MNDFRKGFLGSIAVYVAEFVVMVSGFLLSVLLVRGLSEEHYGSYSLIGSILIVATYFSSLGLEQVIMRYVPEYHAAKRWGSINKVVGISAALRSGALFVFCLLMLAFRVQVIHYLKLPPVLSVWYVAILAIVVLERLKVVFGAALLQAYIEQRCDSANLIFYHLFKLGLIWWMLNSGKGLAGVLLAWLIAEAVSTGHYFFMAIRIIMVNRKRATATDEPPIKYRRIIRFGLFGFLGITTMMFKEIMVDNLVIAYFLDLKQVALYSLAARVMTMAAKTNPTDILRGVFTPLLVKRYTKTQNPQDMIDGFVIFTKLSLFAIVPVFSGLALLADKVIIHIFEPAYLESIPVLYVLLSFFIINCMTYAFVPIVNTLERNELIFYSGFFTFYNLVMDIILVPRMGIMGAAIATGSTGVFTYIYYWVAFRWVLKLRLTFPIASAGRICVNTAIMGAVVYIMRPMINGVAGLAVAILAGMAIYTVLSYVFKSFSPKEREFLNKAMGRNLWVF